MKKRTQDELAEAILNLLATHGVARVREVTKGGEDE